MIACTLSQCTIVLNIWNPVADMNTFTALRRSANFCEKWASACVAVLRSYTCMSLYDMEAKIYMCAAFDSVDTSSKMFVMCGIWTDGKTLITRLHGVIP